METKDIRTPGVQPLEEMSDFFNTRAGHYNTVHLGHVGGMESKQIIASFLPGHTKTVIDFGIGTGLELEGIFERFPHVEVTGLDIAENMLQLLRETYSDKNIHLHCTNYFEVDFGIELYDAAISVMTLHHYTHEVKAGLYKRIRNCIKPKGVYIECDYMLSECEHENAREMEDFYFSEYERLKNEQGLTDDRQYHYDTPCTVKHQIKMLLEAGFTDVVEVWRRENTVILMAGT
ncbi:MAG: class I SAM-dependent methyltransferase [Oscillospiraceae bacterium]|nr:class I SAM-dependent methyltransferase [Oscillospiraceae bacterium]